MVFKFLSGASRFGLRGRVLSNQQDCRQARLVKSSLQKTMQTGSKAYGMQLRFCNRDVEQHEQGLLQLPLEPHWLLQTSLHTDGRHSQASLRRQSATARTNHWGIPKIKTWILIYSTRPTCQFLKPWKNTWERKYNMQLGHFEQPIVQTTHSEHKVLF